MIHGAGSRDSSQGENKHLSRVPMIGFHQSHTHNADGL